MTLNIGFIGDSITLGSYLNPGENPAARCGAILAAGLGETVNIVNLGANGSTSDQWRPSQAFYYSGTSAFASAGVTDVLMMLGANDCKTGVDVSGATFQSNISEIVNQLITDGYLRVWLNYPSWCTWDVGSPTLHLVEYQISIQNVANGTTIRVGDTTAYSFFEANQDLLLDGVHPLATGANDLGGFWAAPLLAFFGARVVRKSWKGARLQRR